MTEENFDEQEEIIEDEVTVEVNVKKKKKKEDEEEIDTSIRINSWSFVFFVLFAAIIGYIAAAYQTGLPPFITGTLGEVTGTNPTILVIFIVAGLVCLGLGYYFGWIRKKPETTVTITSEEVEDDISAESITEEPPEKEEEKSEENSTS